MTEPTADTAVPLLHTISGALARVSIGRSAFYELIKGGQIKVVKIGRRTYVSESELARFVSELEAGQGAR